MTTPTYADGDACCVRCRIDVIEDDDRMLWELDPTVRAYVRHPPRECLLRAERDEARAWVRRLTATERVLTCAFCGEAYPPGTPDSNDSALLAHVKVCAKHPIRDVEAEVRRLRAAVEEAHGASQSIVGKCERYVAEHPLETRQ